MSLTIPRVLITFAALSLFVAAPIVHAQDAGTMPPPPPPKPLDQLRNQLQNVRQDAQNARQNLQDQTRLRLNEAEGPGEKMQILRNAAEERVDIARQRVASSTGLLKDFKGAVRQHGGLVRERLVLAQTQLNRLLERIKSRITKMNEEGIDTSSVAALMSTAEAQIDEVEAGTAELKTYIESVPEGTDRTQVRENMRSMIDEVQTDIREARRALMDLVRALAALTTTKDNPATTTTTTNPTE